MTNKTEKRTWKYVDEYIGIMDALSLLPKGKVDDMRDHMYLHLQDIVLNPPCSWGNHHSKKDMRRISKYIYLIRDIIYIYDDRNNDHLLNHLYEKLRKLIVVPL